MHLSCLSFFELEYLDASFHGSKPVDEGEDVDRACKAHRRSTVAAIVAALKVARALAFVAIGLGLHGMGLDMSHDVVSDLMQLGIVLLFGIVVGLCFVAAAFFIWRADVPEPN